MYGEKIAEGFGSVAINFVFESTDPEVDYMTIDIRIDEYPIFEKYNIPRNADFKIHFTDKPKVIAEKVSMIYFKPSEDPECDICADKSTTVIYVEGYIKIFKVSEKEYKIIID